MLDNLVAKARLAVPMYFELDEALGLRKINDKVSAAQAKKRAEADRKLAADRLKYGEHYQPDPETGLGLSMIDVISMFTTIGKNFYLFSESEKMTQFINNNREIFEDMSDLMAMLKSLVVEPPPAPDPEIIIIL